MSYQLQYLAAGGRVNLQFMTDELAELGGQTPVEHALAGGDPQRVGSFKFYFADERWEWSPQVERMHGYEPGSVEVLKWRSQETNTKLRALAEQLVRDFLELRYDEDLPRRSAYDRLLLTAHYRVVS